MKLVRFLYLISIDESSRIEEDFPKRIKQISAFLKRCKPFTSGIEFAFDQINDNFNKILKEVNQEVIEKNLDHNRKIKEIKTKMVEAIKLFANIKIINANQAICGEAVQQIKSNEVILTYGSNYTIR